jgi:hypothetical protein
MATLIYPLAKNDKIISIRSNDYSGDTDKIVPYRVNGKEYTVKILRAPSENTVDRIHVNKPNNANPNILGYANQKLEFFFPTTLELIPEEKLGQFDFHNGYFESEWYEGEYEIRMQRYYKPENKIYEIGHKYSFKPYETPLTNENVRRRNQAALNKKEAEKREALENLKDLVTKYQSNSNNPSILLGIRNQIFAWPTLEREITVFRGQRDPMVQLIRTAPHRFFSTSLDWVTSDQQFASYNDKCCLFVIHAQPGVKYYSIVGDINEAIRNYNAVRAGNESASNRLSEREAFEEEVLLEGNGVFYKDKAKTARGFRELSVEELDRLKIGIGERPMTHTENGKTVTQTTGVFEAYYFPPEGNNKQGGKRRKSRKQVQKKKKRGTRRH